MDHHRYCNYKTEGIINPWFCLACKVIGNAKMLEPPKALPLKWGDDVTDKSSRTPYAVGKDLQIEYPYKKPSSENYIIFDYAKPICVSAPATAKGVGAKCHCCCCCCCR